MYFIQMGRLKTETFSKANFDRPFSNWKAAVGLKNTNLDDLARNSFLHSAGATVLVLVVLTLWHGPHHTGH